MKLPSTFAAKSALPSCNRQSQNTRSRYKITEAFLVGIFNDQSFATLFAANGYTAYCCIEL
jgi:hypothetical protein